MKYELIITLYPLRLSQNRFEVKIAYLVSFSCSNMSKGYGVTIWNHFEDVEGNEARCKLNR